MDIKKQTLRLVQILYFAIGSSMLFLPAITYIVPPTAAPEMPGTALEILNVLGPTFIGLSAAVWRMMKSSALAAFAPNDEGVRAFSGRYVMAAIVSLALRDAGVIIGFIISFTTGDNSTVIAFAAIATLVNLYDAPREIDFPMTRL